MIKLTPLAVVLALSLASHATAQSEPAGEEAVIERILELQGQIDELVAALPPAARQELERRLAERGTPAMVAAPAASPPVAPAPTPEPAAPPPAAPAPAVEPPPAEPKPPLRRRLARGPHCNFLEALDSNEDGKISALDRYWRHLWLWSDGNGDRTVQEDEVASAYDRNVREIAVDLSTFIRKKGTIGEIRMRSAGGGETLRLDVRGDGFGGADDAVLVVDATRLQRGSGPEVLSAAGEPLEGFQPFQEGWQIRDDAGQVTVLRCP